MRAFMAPGIFPAISWLSRQRLVSDLYKRLLVEGDNVDSVRRRDELPQPAARRPARAARVDPSRPGARRRRAAARSRTSPALIIVAADDRIVDVPLLRATVAAMDHVRLAAIADAGHGWTEGYVRRQLELISAFLLDRPLPGSAAVSQVA